MKYYSSFLFTILLLACSSSVDNDNSTNSDTVMKKLSHEAFQTKLKNTKTAQLIDVRTPEEYKDGFIEGATNMNFYDSDFQDKLNTLDKNKPVLVYCKSGGRSAKTCKKLQNAGFKEVYDLKGGYTAWPKAE